MIGAKVGGIPELREALAGVAPKLRVRALRNALGAGGREVRAAMRSAAPSLSSLDAAVVRGRRTPGLLKKSIVVRTSREARKAGNVGVFVNVRPAKAGNRGAKSKLDPFYWRFVAFGMRSAATSNHEHFPTTTSTDFPPLSRNWGAVGT